MSIDQDGVELEEVELEEVEEVKEEEAAVEEVEEVEEVVEKPKETLEDKETRLERQLNQTRKKMGKDKPKSKQSDEFDYGQYAYLKQAGIESDEDIAFVKEKMEDSGKTLRDTLKANWFKAELKERKELATTAEAIPKDSNSKGTAMESVDYWKGKEDSVIQKNAPKGMLIKVVNARLAEEKSGGQFYNS